VDPVPEPLLLRKSGSAGNRNRDLWFSNQEVRPLNHRGGPTRGLNLLDNETEKGRMPSSELLRHVDFLSTDNSRGVINNVSINYQPKDSANVVPTLLMMEALRSSKISVLTRATRLNIPEVGILHSYRQENLKSYIALTDWTL
jgi:hypothetical protein